MVHSPCASLGQFSLQIFYVFQKMCDLLQTIHSDPNFLLLKLAF